MSFWQRFLDSIRNMRHKGTYTVTVGEKDVRMSLALFTKQIGTIKQVQQTATDYLDAKKAYERDIPRARAFIEALSKDHDDNALEEADLFHTKGCEFVDKEAKFIKLAHTVFAELQELIDNEQNEDDKRALTEMLAELKRIGEETDTESKTFISLMNELRTSLHGPE